jgi:hypothetical protein
MATEEFLGEDVRTTRVGARKRGCGNIQLALPEVPLCGLGVFEEAACLIDVLHVRRVLVAAKKGLELGTFEALLNLVGETVDTDGMAAVESDVIDVGRGLKGICSASYWSWSAVELVWRVKISDALAGDIYVIKEGDKLTAKGAFSLVVPRRFRKDGEDLIPVLAIHPDKVLVFGQSDGFLRSWSGLRSGLRQLIESRHCRRDSLMHRCQASDATLSHRVEILACVE